MTMKYLDELLADVEVISHGGDLHREITGIEYDSRRIENGNCFLAIRGFKKDGLEYIDEALKKGAAAVISEASLKERFKNTRDFTWIQVRSDRKALSRLAAAFYDNPAEKMYSVGVTGTNGKTTVMSLVAAILRREGKTAAVGTLGMSCDGIFKKTTLTTPEAPDIFRFLAHQCQPHCQHLVLEVSSVGLKLQRVENIPFSQAIFTTFSGDHLDFHQTMGDYFESKMHLFERLTAEGWAVINIDDSRSVQVIERLDRKYMTYGFSGHADVRPLGYKLSRQGIEAEVQTPKGNIKIESSLIGRLNLTNILAAVTSAMIKGVPFDRIAAAIREFNAVRGRLDVAYSGRFSVLIDYAHTDNALESLLLSLREVAEQRIIIVFGAGGSRDQTKRPRMGSAAARHADFVLVTSDNPRHEEPQAIIADIIKGFPANFNNYLVEVDRETAIKRALDMAEEGDLVVVAGKGHEDYQIFKDRTIHFDDYEVVQKLLDLKEKGGQ